MEIDYSQFEHELQVPLLPPTQAAPVYPGSNSAYGAPQSHMPPHLAAQNQPMY